MGHAWNKGILPGNKKLCWECGMVKGRTYDHPTVDPFSVRAPECLGKWPEGWNENIAQMIELPKALDVSVRWFRVAFINSKTGMVQFFPSKMSRVDAVQRAKSLNEAYPNVIHLVQSYPLALLPRAASLEAAP